MPLPRPHRLASLIFALSVIGSYSSTASGAEPGLATGFDGALRGCEEWVLNPKSWVDGPAPFLAATGLGDQITPLSKVGDFALPPPALRRANHYWRIDATQTAGFVLVTSDQLPMCHITGAGLGDFRTSIDAVFNDPPFQSRWEKTGQVVRGDMTSTSFRSRMNSALNLVVSRVTLGDKPQGGVQMVATAQFDLVK